MTFHICLENYKTKCCYNNKTNNKIVSRGILCKIKHNVAEYIKWFNNNNDFVVSLQDVSVGSPQFYFLNICDLPYLLRRDRSCCFLHAFEFEVAVFLDWLQSRIREHYLLYDLTHNWEGRRDVFMPFPKAIVRIKRNNLGLNLNSTRRFHFPRW